VAKVKMGAAEMMGSLTSKNTIAAHADDIVLF
jgi:hypothetical protein